MPMPSRTLVAALSTALLALLLTPCSSALSVASAASVADSSYDCIFFYPDSSDDITVDLSEAPGFIRVHVPGGLLIIAVNPTGELECGTVAGAGTLV